MIIQRIHFKKYMFALGLTGLFVLSGLGVTAKANDRDKKTEYSQVQQNCIDTKKVYTLYY